VAAKREEGEEDGERKTHGLLNFDSGGFSAFFVCPPHPQKIGKFLVSTSPLHEHRQRLNFLFFEPRLTAFIENSLEKSGIFSGISLAHLSTALKNRPDEKR